MGGKGRLRLTMAREVTRTSEQLVGGREGDENRH